MQAMMGPLEGPTHPRIRTVAEQKVQRGGSNEEVGTSEGYRPGVIVQPAQTRLVCFMPGTLTAFLCFVALCKACCRLA